MNSGKKQNPKKIQLQNPIKLQARCLIKFYVVWKVSKTDFDLVICIIQIWLKNSPSNLSTKIDRK
jgi:hypothetical protein